MRKFALVLVLALMVGLSGCMSSLLSGGESGGVLNDKRSFAMINLDNKIRTQLGNEIAKTSEFEESHIVVSSYNRVVFLGGQTPSGSYRVLAERIAQKIPKVRRIYNEITIGDNSSFKQRAKDSWITATVKGYMVAKEGLRSGSVKVITENGAVYLLGRVSHDQANLAVDVARRTNGVTRVVKIFEYTD